MAEAVTLHEIKENAYMYEVSTTSRKDENEYTRICSWAESGTNERATGENSNTPRKDENQYTKIDSLAESVKNERATGEKSNPDRVQLIKYDPDRTAIKKLYIFCGVLLTIIVILSIAFGVLTNTLIMRIKTLEANSDELQAEIKALQEMPGSERTADLAAILQLNNTVQHIVMNMSANEDNVQEIDARISKLEINTTSEHVTEMAAIEANQQSISTLESAKNDTMDLYENIGLRLNYLEDGLNCTWGDWSIFSPCTATCGAGIQYRERSCDGLNPDFSWHWCSRIETDIQTCNIEPCRQVHGGWTAWSPWSLCTLTCDGGEKTRHRDCTNPAPIGLGRSCIGNSDEISICNGNPCSVNGSWTSWSLWSDCSASCGPGGMIRQRSCSNPQPANGGSGCSGEAIEQKSCQLMVCPVNGGWTDWSLWSSCNASCGSGQLTRQRFCSNPQPANDGSNCSGEAIEHKSCQLMVCPVHGDWTAWSPWSSCTQTCDGGEKRRHRNCTNPAPIGLGRSCIGNSDETSVCNGSLCPVDGGWTDWSLWSGCSASCGSGQLTRQRYCSSPQPANGGNDCSGEAIEQKSCQVMVCPVDGEWADWSLWSGCSSSCDSGQLTRQRSCSSPKPANGGINCSGEAIEQQSCQVMVCPVHGGWTAWSPWSSCTRTCDGGEKKRHRNCTNPAPIGLGRSCIGNSDENSVCNGNPCPVNGGWTDWSMWSGCSASCGTGQLTRQRSCSSPQPSNGGSDCSGEAIEQNSCQVMVCPADCKDILNKSIGTTDNVYPVTVYETGEVIQVFCDMTTDGGGWTVFQKRVNGSVDFYRSFNEYENGFGSVYGEFWLGLKYIYNMIKGVETELRIDLQKSTEEKGHGVWQSFSFSGTTFYRLQIGSYNGTIGDDSRYGLFYTNGWTFMMSTVIPVSTVLKTDTLNGGDGGTGLSFNNNSAFSTFDRDVDVHSAESCSKSLHGAWWYRDCSHANLNGNYATPGTYSPYHGGWGGIIYQNFDALKSLKSTEMKFRRKD